MYELYLRVITNALARLLLSLSVPRPARSVLIRFPISVYCYPVISGCRMSHKYCASSYSARDLAQIMVSLMIPSYERVEGPITHPSQLIQHSLACTQDLLRPKSILIRFLAHEVQYTAHACVRYLLFFFMREFCRWQLSRLARVHHLYSRVYARECTTHYDSRCTTLLWHYIGLCSAAS